LAGGKTCHLYARQALRQFTEARIVADDHHVLGITGHFIQHRTNLSRAG
jgi:hypothetical protein